MDKNPKIIDGYAGSNKAESFKSSFFRSLNNNQLVFANNEKGYKINLNNIPDNDRDPKIEFDDQENAFNEFMNKAIDKSIKYTNILDDNLANYKFVNIYKSNIIEDDMYNRYMSSSLNTRSIDKDVYYRLPDVFPKSIYSKSNKHRDIEIIINSLFVVNYFLNTSIFTRKCILQIPYQSGLNINNKALKQKFNDFVTTRKYKKLYTFSPEKFAYLQLTSAYNQQVKKNDKIASTKDLYIHAGAWNSLGPDRMDINFNHVGTINLKSKVQSALSTINQFSTILLKCLIAPFTTDNSLIRGHIIDAACNLVICLFGIDGYRFEITKPILGCGYEFSDVIISLLRNKFIYGSYSFLRMMTIINSGVAPYLTTMNSRNEFDDFHYYAFEFIRLLFFDPTYFKLVKVIVSELSKFIPYIPKDIYYASSLDRIKNCENVKIIDLVNLYLYSPFSVLAKFHFSKEAFIYRTIRIKHLYLTNRDNTYIFKFLNSIWRANINMPWTCAPLIISNTKTGIFSKILKTGKSLIDGIEDKHQVDKILKYIYDKPEYRGICFIKGTKNKTIPISSMYITDNGYIVSDLETIILSDKIPYGDYILPYEEQFYSIDCRLTSSTINQRVITKLKSDDTHLANITYYVNKDNVYRLPLLFKLNYFYTMRDYTLRQAVNYYYGSDKIVFDVDGKEKEKEYNLLSFDESLFKRE